MIGAAFQNGGNTLLSQGYNPDNNTWSSNGGKIWGDAGIAALAGGIGNFAGQGIGKLAEKASKSLGFDPTWKGNFAGLKKVSAAREINGLVSTYTGNRIQNIGNGIINRQTNVIINSSSKVNWWYWGNSMIGNAYNNY